MRLSRKVRAAEAARIANLAVAGTSLEALAPQPVVDQPVAETPVAETPVAETLVVHSPAVIETEEPKAEEPKAEEPKTEAQPVVSRKTRIRDRVVPPSERVKPIRTGTKQAHVLSCMDAGTEIMEIVRIVGVNLREVKHHILNLAEIGVGNEVKNGHVKALYPEGFKYEDCFKTRTALTDNDPTPPAAPVELHPSLVEAGY